MKGVLIMVMDENQYVVDQLKDHEGRLRRLEESDVAQRIQLTNIEKSQAEIKLMMSEQSKEHQNMFNNFTAQMIDYFKEKESKEHDEKIKEKEIQTENNKINNEIKFYNTKQFWVIISAIVTGILVYFGLK
jgi:hypothetical protein